MGKKSLLWNEVSSTQLLLQAKEKFSPGGVVKKEHSDTVTTKTLIYPRKSTTWLGLLKSIVEEISLFVQRKMVLYVHSVRTLMVSLASLDRMHTKSLLLVPYLSPV